VTKRIQRPIQWCQFS